MWAFLLIIFLSAIGVVGDYFLKMASHGVKPIDWRLFILGVITYGSTSIGWFFVLKHLKLSSLGIIYSLTTILLLIAVGVFCFGEKLTSTEILGVVAAVVSFALLLRFV